MKRRKLLGLALAAALTTTSSLAATPVYVVKQILFTCPICRASETIDSAISTAVRETGGKLVYAPLPVDGDVGAAFYFAARTVSDEFSDKVRLSFYKATQDMGLELNEQFRAYVWLQQDVTNPQVDWGQFLAATESTEVKKALLRSVRLAREAGVSATPSYVVIVEGRAVEVIDPTTVTPANSVAAMRQAVLAAVKKHSKPTTN